MSIADLTAKMNAFVDSQGWYSADSARPQTPKNLALSLILEAGEVLEHFQWQEHAADRDALADELADVALYLLQLAAVCDIDLQQAILDKLARNQTRTWTQHRPAD